MDEISISNMAISWCGGNLITSFDDESDEADLCRVAYEPSRDLILEGKDWTFAAHRMRLAPGGEEPAFEYKYAFTLPPDLLVLRQISDNVNMRKIDFVRESNQILANFPVLYLKYTRKFSNINAFSPSFVYSLAHKMAANIAIPLTENRTLKQEMEELSLMYMEVGGSIDGTQTKVGKVTASKIKGARYR